VFTDDQFVFDAQHLDFITLAPGANRVEAGAADFMFKVLGDTIEKAPRKKKGEKEVPRTDCLE
jgi:hypothetical protein